MPISAALPPDRIPDEIAYCDIEYMVTTPEYREFLRPIDLELCQVKGLFVLERARERGYVFCPATPLARRFASDEANDRNEEYTAIMLPTSGTISRPKRVMLSHRNLLENMLSFLDMAELQETDVGLIALPLTSSGTNTTEMLAYLWQGMTVVIYPHHQFLLGEYCKLLQEESVTVVNVTPMILNMILRKKSEVVKKISTVKKIFFASSPIGRQQLLELARAFPHVDFYYGYGLTEASPRCAMLRPELLCSKLGSSGTPLKNIKVKVVDHKRRPVAPGELGEIAVSGPNVMVGYYKRTEETRAVLEDGWLYTGDLGFLDEDGFLYVKGRRKNVIISRGISVCPEEIEEAILQHSSVREAYVTSARDDLMCERIIAYVVPEEGARASEFELRDFLLTKLEPLKLPGRIIFVPQLPRNESHKILRGQTAAGYCCQPFARCE